MSRTTWVVLLAKTLTAPPAPAGTIAAVDLVRPSSELAVETKGCTCPVGHSVRNPRGPAGTTATFSENACAVGGMLHGLIGIIKLRAVPPAISGPPKGPAGSRVSTKRQGVTGMKRRACAGVIVVEFVALAFTDPPPETDT